MMMAINRTRGTAIGGALFVSLLISGNSVSTVEANCLTDKYTEIIRSDTAEICQTYTIKKGMNYSLPGYYMYKAKDLSVENVVMNEEKIFNLKKLTEIEKNITFNVFNYLYGSGGLTSKLYQSIREKNSLCYAISSMYLKYDKLLLVHISLEQANVKKATSLVKKELKNMQVGNFTEEELKDAINNMIVSLDMAQDNNVSIINNYVFHVFDNLPMPEERVEMFKNIKKEDVINVAKKVKLNTVFTLEGRNK